MVNSKQKGSAGEREASKVLNALLGTKCRRGQQYSGSPDSPDIVGLPGVHIECKRVQKLNLEKALAQANEDKGEGDIPMIMHRKNGQPWLITIQAEDLLQFIERINSARPASPES